MAFLALILNPDSESILVLVDGNYEYVSSVDVIPLRTLKRVGRIKQDVFIHLKKRFICCTNFLDLTSLKRGQEERSWDRSQLMKFSRSFAALTRNFSLWRGLRARVLPTPLFSTPGKMQPPSQLPREDNTTRPLNGELPLWPALLPACLLCVVTANCSITAY